MNGGKVPYRLHPTFDKPVGSLLRDVDRHGQDGHLDAEAIDHTAALFHRQNDVIPDMLIYLGKVRIESGRYSEAVFSEAGIAKQSASDAAAADQYGICMLGQSQSRLERAVEYPTRGLPTIPTEAISFRTRVSSTPRISDK